MTYSILPENVLTAVSYTILLQGFKIEKHYTAVLTRTMVLFTLVTDYNVC